MTVTIKKAAGIFAAVLMLVTASGALTLYLPEKISPEAYRASLQSLESYRRAHPQEYIRMLAVVDYSKPSYLKRMALVDMKTGEQAFYLVAHGKRSGELYARHFSDTPESNMSSLGLYKVLGMYNGDHGMALRLEGLEPGRNGNAYRRDIVLHSAEYVSLRYIILNLVTLEGPRIGRSNGCFVVPAGKIEEVAQRLGRGGFIYAWAEEEIEMD
ncbi:murein L,D-transpeptidase catalytic domain family protein [Chlorobium sp.]|uniref:murein L,D-transpeptidase catalytic domain family protein n=1 Tax=Chlorobium sp. TaxID=1095 RepID=UPI002F41E6BC